jgi:hypothetical protein
MKIKYIVLAASISLSSVALATDGNESFEVANIANFTQMNEQDAQTFATGLVAAIKNASSQVEFVKSLFTANKENANVVYAAAVQAGLEQELVVAAGLTAGVDPSVMLDPTAFNFGFFALPPGFSFPAPPPPPPAVPICGPGGSGGVCISTN